MVMRFAYSMASSRNAFLALVVVAFTLGSQAWAQEEEPEEISVVGTRSLDRSSADLAVPVDVLEGSEFIEQGDTRMDSMLSRVAPSVNVSQQPISDAGTLVRPVNMRGLPPDSTLVLVNGKRRHRSSVITFLGAGLSDGSHPVDMSAIPAIALGRVEVLRDGAAAQYGSDAVAGIVNFVLKEDDEGGQLMARYGQYYYGDGENITVAGNFGLPLTDRGFLNISGEYNTSDPTSRSVQRADAQALIDAGNDAIRTPATGVWGAPEIDDNYKLFANAGIELSDTTELYSFANYAERTVDGGFYYRNPYTRSGVFEGDGNSDDADGHYLLVIDQVPNGGPDCPALKFATYPPDHQDIQQKLGTLPDGCYAFNQRFPGGFTPQFGGDIEDMSAALGVRGELMDGELTFDLSGVYGEHETDFFIYNTINPQLAHLGNDIPTYYDPGLYREKDHAFNLDFTTEVEIAAFSSPLNIGFGFEKRNEEFEIEPGELNSWLVAYRNDADSGDTNIYYVDADDSVKTVGGDSTDLSTDDIVPFYGGLGDGTISLGVGSNGFTGFRPDQTGKWDRDSIAAYIDFEADVTDDLLLGVALRHEDPEDFDATLDGKVSARIQLTDTLALRSSYGTGFRVPTVGQANVRNVTTAFSSKGLVDRLTLPASDPVLAGIASPLEQEESTSFGLGAVFNIDDLDVTIDYYHIEVDDRIAQTQAKDLDKLLKERADFNPAADEEAELKRIKDSLFDQGVTNIYAIGQVSWFANDFDTVTEGVDVVATYPMDLESGASLDVTLTGNLTRTEVTDYNTETIGDKKRRQIEESLPKLRFTVTGDYEMGPWKIISRLRYYGGHIEYHADTKDWFLRADDRWLFDLSATYNVNDNFSMTVGADNLFDVDPDKNPHATEVGSEFGESIPFDYNGGFYYMQATYNF